jgi:positive regulator of sigma E activity
MTSRESDQGSISAEQLFRILSTEQQHIDKQIESMMDLQTKILAFLFPALAVAAGWILTALGRNDTPLSAAPQAAVLFTLDAALCFGILLSVICYASAAEYTRYKKEILGPRFISVLGAEYSNPLDADSWGKSGLGIALKFAVSSLWLVITTVMGIVLTRATGLTITLQPQNSVLRTVMWLSYALSSISILAAIFSANASMQRFVRRHFRKKGDLEPNEILNPPPTVGPTEDERPVRQAVEVGIPESKYMDRLQSYYDEHAAQARQHEEQRERATNLILSIAGLLVGLITFAKLSLWSLPAAVCIALLGSFGFLFAGKHYERFRFHTEIMDAIRREIERVSNDPESTPKTLSALRDDGELRHYEEFTWPSFRGSRSKPQSKARSWIARQRLHVFWEFVHLLVVVIGIPLCVAIGLGTKFRKEPKPLKVEIISPATTPNKADLGKAASP